MKMSRFKKILLTLALIIVVQNGVIVVPDLPDDTYTGEESVSPCNDEPTKGGDILYHQAIKCPHLVLHPARN